MPVKIDLSNAEALALLEKARTAGFLNVEDLLPFCSTDQITPEVVKWLRAALWAEGVELTEGMTQEERDRLDEASLDGLRKFYAEGGHASLSGRGWATVIRGIAVKKRKGLE